ncbi:globin domain-containing protein [Rapidithrix thailandica]|uniref:Globin domain-containing protein n=1 Tax=Rapidithrix thailandica TaxID=413964 RepID=A0AAW9S4Y3_9BACT
MTEREILLVQQSWSRVENHLNELGERFYESLFEMEPQFQNLFKNDSKKQSVKFIHFMTILVSKLHEEAKSDQDLQALAKRHHAYRVEEAYFAKFGVVLMKTLEEFFQTEWTEELRLAWQNAFVQISGRMVQYM